MLAIPEGLTKMPFVGTGLQAFALHDLIQTDET